ncbi:glycosyltransferase [Paeniglutamicibacter sp. ABSL32-1]|uniref:glycosyltransferase family 2 protein n=1 Tax=Paeniglutamicibacter quisquiliarum TaxID=2849498 RepID=UPI001C2D3B51|nr:glycosyltransferase family 2 protein [Paeniglutamicibacter quisquiliarum]MBV1779205.1 glycosyltransferase [Paeniglutamicibacter quisquiliarum]
MARVSVVIPCFNYAAYLPAAVHSVIGQAGIDLQIIVVNDASTDDSLHVANELAHKFAQVTVLHNERNRGPVETFNRGLERATGEFLVRLDADDLLTPGSLHRAVAVARSDPMIGLVYGHPIHFSGDSLPKARDRVKGWAVWEGLQWLEDRCRTGVNVITSPEVLMRMSVVRQVGGQRDLAHSHDMEMWMRIASVSRVAYIRGADQAWHRDHALSLSARKVDFTTDFEQRWLAFETLFDHCQPAEHRFSALRLLARETLIEEGIRSARVELQLGLPDRERFAAWMSMARRIGPNESQAARLARLENQAHGPQASPFRRADTFLRRVYRRMMREYRQRHWASYGIY